MALAVLDPSPARLLLVVHAIVGAVVVATTTHLAVWSAPYLRGRPARHRGVRLFTLVALASYVVQWLLGNLVYPTYVVRVRDGYLETPVGVAADLGWVGRIFEIKEHWAALAFPLLVAAAILAFRRSPGSAAPASPRPIFLCALGATLCCWSAAIIGLVVTSVRSIGGAP